MTVSEIAMQLDTSRRAGKSKMKVARTAIGYVSLWRDKARWRRVAERASTRGPTIPDLST
jgi:hypothetical protein